MAVDYLESAVRRLGRHNAALADRIHEAARAGPLLIAPPSSQITTAADDHVTAAAAPEPNGGASSAAAAAAEEPLLAAAAAVAAGQLPPPVSPRTLQKVLSAANKVHLRNKQLKEALASMQRHAEGRGGQLRA
jgi:hypothetical protein